MPADTRSATAAAIFEAFNRRDIEGLLTHLHPDYEITWPHGVLTGVDAMAHEASILEAMPDLRASILAIHETADHVIVEVEMVGTQTGSLVTPEGPVIPPSGQRWVTPMVVVLAFEDGLLHRERIYGDRFAPIAATGALDAFAPTTERH
jgi:ketosteroid isomerase-like protein